KRRSQSKRPTIQQLTHIGARGTAAATGSSRKPIAMKVTQLKRVNDGSSPGESMRSTAGQDTVVADERSAWRRHIRWYAVAGAALIFAVTVAWLAHKWAGSAHTISADRLRITTVKRGHFVRD